MRRFLAIASARAPGQGGRQVPGFNVPASHRARSTTTTRPATISPALEAKYADKLKKQIEQCVCAFLIERFETRPNSRNEELELVIYKPLRRS